MIWLDSPWALRRGPVSWCELGQQSRAARDSCDAQQQVQSGSTRRRRSTSGGLLLCLDRPDNAAWSHPLPHGRPLFTMADVGCMAASAWHLREPQRRSLPPATAGGSGVRLPGGGSMDDYLFTASQGAWLKPGLELSNPLTLPSLDHMLTSTFLNPHRSLARRRLRHQRPWLDGPRPRACWHDRCRRHQPLRRHQTRLERGTLV